MSGEQYANSNVEKLGHEKKFKHFVEVDGSVPDPDPPDPHVFGPPGSGSTIQMNGSGAGSGSFYHEAKIVRKPWIPTVL
jgi:hypothetical protein